MSRKVWLQEAQVLADELADQLLDSFTPSTGGRPVCARFERRQRIGDGDRAFGRAQEGVIVFSIADTHDVMQGCFQLSQGSRQSGALRHAGR